MRTNWMGAVSLVLSAITLVVVLTVAARPAPQSVDPGPALGGLQSEVSALRSDIAALRSDIAALRAIAVQPSASPNVDQLTAIQARLDSLDATVGAIATKFAALCTAINASPIAPPGGAC